ncbi:MAG: S49 family peptidase [Lysobacter sp.]|nr:S49 family peptidase [Lysobacter sp.]
MKSYSRVYAAVMDRPWALLPSKLAAIVEVLDLRMAGLELSAEEISARIGNPRRAEQSAQGSVAVLPVYGVMSQRMNMLQATSGGASTEMLGRQFSDLVRDPQVGAIILDIDSPGGDVFGTAELGDAIYAARGSKPIVAVANSLAASAAYWIASQADEIVVTPSGQVGSIGVYTAHRDVSAALEQEGEKVTLISAGKYKVEGNPYAALTDEARAAIQDRIDGYYAMFTGAVARGRGVDVADVRGGFGEGRTVGAREAVRLGMADRVGTLQQTIDRYVGQSSGTRSGSRSEAPNPDLVSGLDFRKRRLRMLGR